MLVSERELVFIEINEGKAKESGNPYKIVKLGDPVTFENFRLNADPEKNFANFSRGEKVRIKVDLVEFFGRTQVRLVDIIPAVK